jgi:ring-1,2-phenylacetyl-CoA epoxidase subunit PaaD
MARVQHGSGGRAGGDLVSEATVHRVVATARASAIAAPARVDAGGVRAALADVSDPEIPVVSIVDLGMVEDVEVAADGIRVALLPTFVGCPALDVIRAAVERRLQVFGRPVEVRFDYRVPWTSDRITPEGGAKLRASGFAPPAPSRPDQPVLVQLGEPVACPNCGSRRTVLENAFGPAQCRAIHHCADCRQPFEAFKTI